MSTLRTTGETPSRTRRMARVASAIGTAALAGGLAILAACADAPSAPRQGLTPDAAPRLATGSRVSSYATIGDTTKIVFTVGNDGLPATFSDTAGNRITFPYGAGSICNPWTSSYGSGTWNSSCSPSTQPVTITAKIWKNAQGKISTDFQPALRFVPGLAKSVTLYLKDPAVMAATRIDYCTRTRCVNEAAIDPSLATKRDPTTGFVYRVIKHFSGYTVTAE